MEVLAETKEATKSESERKASEENALRIERRSNIELRNETGRELSSDSSS